MPDYLLQNGLLVDARGQTRGDLLLLEGRIAKADGVHGKSLEVVDCTDCLVLPGMIDPHTHMGIPIKDTCSADDFHTGSRSAVHGGITTILDFSVLRSGETLAASLARRQQEAAGALCHVGLHANLTRFEPSLLKEIPGLIRQGITSFKVFTTYREAGMMLDYPQMEVIARVLAEHGGLLMVHAEDDALVMQGRKKYANQGLREAWYHGLSRPAGAELAAVRELAGIHQRTGCPIYVVHLNTGAGLELARAAGLLVETCPQYLFLDEDAYQREDGRMFVASPPLRSKVDAAVLFQAVLQGEVDTLGSDHCPFHPEQKPPDLDFEDIPNGLPGVETMLPLLLAAWLEAEADLSRLVAVTSRRAAEIFGYGDHKGILEPGADADVIVVDPRTPRYSWETRTVSRIRWQPYQGYPAIFPRHVFVAGRQLVRDGALSELGS